MKILRYSSLLVFCFVVTGCVSPNHKEVSPTAQKIFTYDFKLPSVSKQNLFQRGRNHIATTYGDSTKVIKVEDKAEGVILGKGLTMWDVSLIQCPVEYHIRFAAKEGKARVQYELIDQRPVHSACTGWPWLIVGAYPDIVKRLDSYAANFEKALNQSTSASSFTDF